MRLMTVTIIFSLEPKGRRGTHFATVPESQNLHKNNDNDNVLFSVYFLIGFSLSSFVFVYLVRCSFIQGFGWPAVAILTKRWCPDPQAR